jgi:SAM-dependent methyltransferase
MTCPICESPDTARVYSTFDYPVIDVLPNPPHYEYHRCNDCGLAYRDPLPTQDELDRYYREEYRPVPPDNEEFQKYSRAMADWRVSILSNRGRWERPFGGEPYSNRFVHSLPQGPFILDIGCGDGAFCWSLSRDHHVYGIEPDTTFEHFAPECYSDDDVPELENASVLDWEPRSQHYFFGEDRFDLITAFHVLEHLRDPVAVLRKLSGWLTETGRIWLEVPDYDHPLNGDVTNEYTYPHLWVFTEKSLRLCMERAGLVVCETWNEVAPYTGRTVLFAIGKGGG